MKRITLIMFVLLSAAIVEAESCYSGKVGRDGRPYYMQMGIVPILVVTKSAEGFTPTKNVADSTKDLIKSLVKKKGLCVTDNPEEAKIVLEVLGREKAQITATYGGIGRDVIVAVKLTAGTYETVISESASGTHTPGAWSKAAGKVAKRVEEWVKENREMLTSKE